MPTCEYVTGCLYLCYLNNLDNESQKLYHCPKSEISENVSLYKMQVYQESVT